MPEIYLSRMVSVELTISRFACSLKKSLSDYHRYVDADFSLSKSSQVAENSRSDILYAVASRILCLMAITGLAFQTGDRHLRYECLCLSPTHFMRDDYCILKKNKIFQALRIHIDAVS
jgi:hypothetical protein